MPTMPAEVELRLERALWSYGLHRAGGIETSESIVRKGDLWLAFSMTTDPCYSYWSTKS